MTLQKYQETILVVTDGFLSVQLKMVEFNKRTFLNLIYEKNRTTFFSLLYL